MSICRYCGGEVEFRHVDGQVTPIHLSGGWCSGGGGFSSSGSSGRAFESYASYVNPNARCPECNAEVYFYQSPYGGRVFFDDLGWPWPKHPCTDKPSVQTGKFHRLEPKRSRPFRSAGGEKAMVFRLAELTSENDQVCLKLCELDNPLVVLRLQPAAQSLRDADITLNDLKAAPSFVVRFFDSHRSL